MKLSPITKQNFSAYKLTTKQCDLNELEKKIVQLEALKTPISEFHDIFERQDVKENIEDNLPSDMFFAIQTEENITNSDNYFSLIAQTGYGESDYDDEFYYYGSQIEPDKSIVLNINDGHLDKNQLLNWIHQWIHFYHRK